MIVTVNDCPCCGDDPHDDLSAEPATPALLDSGELWPWKARCPTTGGLILLQVDADENVTNTG